MAPHTRIPRQSKSWLQIDRNRFIASREGAAAMISVQLEKTEVYLAC